MKRTLAFLICTVLTISLCTAAGPAVLHAEEEESSTEEISEENGQDKNTSDETVAEDNASEGNNTEENSAGETDTQIEISAPSAVLMEASTATVLYEKDADTARPPASVTKIMTMLLIFDALNNGTINLDDEVTTSEYAASMGG